MMTCDLLTNVECLEGGYLNGLGACVRCLVKRKVGGEERKKGEVTRVVNSRSRSPYR